MSDGQGEGEMAPTGIDARPRTTVALAVLAGWLVLHVATPLSYYLSSDVYDERFAWRMFSAVRVQQCAVEARETIGDGAPRPIPVASVLPAPWISLLQRNRPAVIARFLAFRCASDAHPTEVRLTHTCRSVAGETLPAVHRTMRCADRGYEETTDE